MKIDDLYYEGFDEWMRARIKTKPDLKYWSEEEEAAAEFAWCEAWDNAEKSFELEVKRLEAVIKSQQMVVARLEHENSFLESVNVQLSQKKASVKA